MGGACGHEKAGGGEMYEEEEKTAREGYFKPQVQMGGDGGQTRPCEGDIGGREGRGGSLHTSVKSNVSGGRVDTSTNITDGIAIWNI